MNITDEQFSKIREKLGDKELKEMGIKLPCDVDKIYGVKSHRKLYKLQQIHHDSDRPLFAWVNLDSSYCFANGTKETLKECLESIGGYQEFDNIKDFAQWILRESI